MYPLQQQQRLLTEGEFQRRQDTEHLKLLSIFYYVQAGIALLMGCYFLIYLFLGIFGGSLTRPGEQPFPTTMFILMGAIGFTVGLIGAALNLVAGRSLTRRQNRTLLYIMAGLNCMNAPYGTILGVFTFVILGRPTVKTLFDGQDPYGPSPTEPERASGSWYQSQGGNF